MAGLAALGCEPQAAEGHRLTSLNCVKTPAGVEEAPIRKALLLRHDIEIGGGLGPLAGKVWRVGLMGESARQANVFAVLGALEEELARTGRQVSRAASLKAAVDVYARA
jgi:alanine-glyoxylate transaminase/serine-glyoxylate transaminase/serine-pyruvate transaminase